MLFHSLPWFNGIHAYFDIILIMILRFKFTVVLSIGEILSFLFEISASLSQGETRIYIQMHSQKLIKVSLNMLWRISFLGSKIRELGSKWSGVWIPDVDRKPNFEFIKSALVQANNALFDQITIGTIRIVCFRQIYRWLKHPFDCTFEVWRILCGSTLDHTLMWLNLKSNVAL